MNDEADGGRVTKSTRSCWCGDGRIAGNFFATRQAPVLFRRLVRQGWLGGTWPTYKPNGVERVFALNDEKNERKERRRFGMAEEK